MAQMDTSDSGGKKKGGKVRSKKMSTRIDLTPMVDLGFLLITFFMLTTTLSKPQTMEINMPAKPENEDERPPIKESKVLNLMLTANDKVYYYQGNDYETIDSTDFSAKGVRDVILRKQSEVATQHGDKDETIVLIKAAEDAKYKNLVDILDEMSITGTKIYALIDLVPQEKDLLLLTKEGKKYVPVGSPTPAAK